MALKFDQLAHWWRRVKSSSQFHNVLMYLIFVAIAMVFWFIISLNDSVTETFKVKMVIQQVPDSVTFINDPPSEIHVTLRDKGTNILRSGFVKDPVLEINFNDYAHDGILRISPSDLVSELKADFGGVAQITSSSIDSLRCYYTSQPGKRVPVIVKADVSAASGYIIRGVPSSLKKSVLVYSYGSETDTVHQVYTRMLSKKDLSQTSVFTVGLAPMRNVKIVPSKVDVKVLVEPLVHKEVYVTVETQNIPVGKSLLLFPPRVPVSYYVPMSDFNNADPRVKVIADYNDIKSTGSSKVPVRIEKAASNLVNVELKADSVEYTLVKH